MLDWNRLLSTWRTPFPGKSPGPAREQSFRSHFESDYDRIVYSQPFRRLARKTQVHPTTVNDHVHNRLTHSIEVASVGRSFGRRLAAFLESNQLLPAEHAATTWRGFSWRRAPLHDIGNPPFGHAGEAAIRESSASHMDIVFPDDLPVSEPVRQDVLVFEGNAQGFRIAAHHGQSAHRLPPPHLRDAGRDRIPMAVHRRACGVEGQAQLLLLRMVDFSGSPPTPGPGRSRGSVPAHPLSFLSEAADDICYRVLDLEDAAELRIISESRVRATYVRFLGQAPSVSMPLPRLRGEVIQRLIEESSAHLYGRLRPIMAGQRPADLKSSFDEELIRLGRGATNLRRDLRRSVEGRRRAGGLQGGTGRIMKALCNATGQLARVRDPSRLRFVSRHCLDFAWSRQHVEQNAHQSYEWWLHQVLDYVSALADTWPAKFQGRSKALSCRFDSDAPTLRFLECPP